MQRVLISCRKKYSLTFRQAMQILLVVDYLATYAVTTNQATPDHKPIVNWSDHGRYSAIFLEYVVSRRRLMYVSVHLRHNETTRKTAITPLKTFLDEAIEKNYVDDIVVAGDFNTKPEDIQFHLGSQFRVCIQAGTPTTNTGSTIDNVVTSDGVKSCLRPMTESKLTHLPILGELYFES